MDGGNGQAGHRRTAGTRPRIRGILFDKDGTLLDYHRSWGPLNVAAAGHASAGDALLAGRLLAVGGYDAATGSTRPDSLLAAAPNRTIAAAWIAAGSPFTEDRLTADLDALFAGAAGRMVPVADVAGLFARLKARGVMTGIASSDSEAGIRAFAARFGLDGFLDFVAGYDSGHGMKPDARVLASFCAAAALDPSDVAVVGDNRHDLEMARAGGAGFAVGVLDTGTGTAESLSGLADLCIPSVASLEQELFGAG